MNALDDQPTIDTGARDSKCRAPRTQDPTTYQTFMSTVRLHPPRRVVKHSPERPIYQGMAITRLLQIVFGFALALLSTAAPALAADSVEYPYVGAYKPTPGDGVVFHLANKNGEGGKLSVLRINMHLDCPSGPYGVQLGDYALVGINPAVRNGKLDLLFEQEDVFVGTMRVNVAVRFCGLPGLAKCRDSHGRKIKKFKSAKVGVGVTTPNNAVEDQCTGYMTDVKTVNKIFITP